MCTPTSFESPVWLMIGATQTRPGYLTLDGGTLTLEVEEKTLFDVQLHQVEDVTFPWYYFGGGDKMSVEGEHYRLSFVQPNGAMSPYDRSAGFDSIQSIGSGRAAGKAWKEALT